MLMPKWWLLHLFVLAAVLVMLRLGLWQWHRAGSPTGGIQNYAYAVQWPLFAAFAVFLWVRTLIEEARRDRSSDADGVRPSAAPTPDSVIVRQHGVRIGITTQSVPIDEDDAEVVAWNARLAALNAAAAAAESRRR